MMGHYWGHFGWGFGFGWILMVFFWGLVIWAVLALAHGVFGRGCCGHSYSHNGEKPENNALDILKERYAKGEISKEEFEKIKKDLQ